MKAIFNKLRPLIIAPFFLAGAMAASLAHSSPILINGPDGGSNQIKYFEPSGQSFTALGSSLTYLGFDISDYNPAENDPNFQIELLAGSGTGGLVLGSTTITPGDGFNGFITTTAFNGISLTAGAQYTAILLNDTAQWGFERTGSDVYAGGSGFIGGNAVPFDLFFTADFADGNAVPEPSSIALVALGLFGLVFGLRKRA